MNSNSHNKNIIKIYSAFLWLVVSCSPVSAMTGSFDISLYGGLNNAAHSSVEFRAATASYGISDGKYSTDGWEGESFKSPIYYGYRLSYLPSTMSSWEFFLDFNHSKVKAKTLPTGLKRLEFTDGINTLTANTIYKFDTSLVYSKKLTPYAGLGIGFAYPHVDVESSTVSEAKTYDYQFTGMAYQLMAGGRIEITDKWKSFAEYRVTFTPIDADLDGGGTISTDILNNQVSFGLVYSF